MNQSESLGKGTIELVLLSLLKQERMYGYQIVQTVSEQTGGMFSLNTGAMYTTLYQLEEAHYITSCKVPVKTRQIRVYYQITDQGIQYLEELLVNYQQMQATLNRLLGVSAQVVQ